MAENERRADSLTVGAANLQERIGELRKEFERRRRLRVGGAIFGGLCALLGLTLFFLDVPLFGLDRSDRHLYLASGVLYGSMLFGFGFLLSIGDITTELRALEDDLDLRNIPSESHEQKAHKLLRIQQHELNRYYGLIFRQARGIFWVGVASLFLGFLIIFLTLAYLGYSLHAKSSPRSEE